MSASGIETRLVRLNETEKGGGYAGRPGDQFVQLVAANGVFLYKDTLFYRATVRLEKLTDPTLADLTEACQLRVPKLDLVLLAKIEDFFTKVFEKYKSEAVVLLYASSKPKGWTARVPEQTVTGAHVSYDMKKMPQAFEEHGVQYHLFGSIHSHGSMPAFHSGTDNEDEYHFDGLHMTIGDIPKPERSYMARYMIHGSVWPMRLRDVVDFPDLPEASADEEWLSKVSEHGPYWAGHGSAIRGPHDWAGAGNVGKATGTGASTSSLRDDRRMPPSGAARKPKLRWKARATYDHCYTCLHYREGGKCEERGRTVPFATCARYSPNSDVPERLTEEAQGWLMLLGGKEEKLGLTGSRELVLPEKKEPLSLPAPELMEGG